MSARNGALDGTAASGSASTAEVTRDTTAGAGSGSFTDAGAHLPRSARPDDRGTPRPGTGRDAGSGEIDPLPAPLQIREPGRYQTIDEHGRGGIGRVLRSQDRELGRTVAIKELIRRGRASEARFFREALLTARLEHPGIVPVYEAGRWPDGTPFYAMKLVAGRPLRVLIDEATTVEQRLALLPHVIAVADAIAYAHSHRIVHRDLKPANVIVGDYGETVVIDWGLAKDLSTGEVEASADPYRTAAHPDLTQIGTVLGTPAFMAPEQARGEPGDERADVYSLGAILYAVLSGRAPYQGSRSDDLVRAVIAGPPPELAASAPGVPADLIAVTAAAMARDPARRMDSAKALADELRRYQRGQLLRSHRYSRAERAARWARRHREASAAIAIAAALLVVGGGLAVSRIIGERDRAEQQRQRAESALRDARDQRDRVVLDHARGDAAHDPTSALGWLAAYRGTDIEKAQEIAALADGRSGASFSRNRQGQRLVGTLATSFDPVRVVAMRADRSVVRYDAGVASPVPLADQVDDLGYNAIAPAVGAIAMATTDGRVLLYRDGRVETIATVAAPVRRVALTPDGKWLVAGSLHGEIARFELGAGRAPLRLDLPASSGGLHHLALAPAGDRLAACDAQGHLWLRSADAPWRAAGDCTLEQTGSIAFSPDGARLAAVHGAEVRIVATERGAERGVDRGATLPAGATEVAFADDGTLLVGDLDGELLAIDPAPEAAPRRLLIGRGAVSAMTVAGDRVAVGFDTGDVAVHARASGGTLHLRGLATCVNDLQLAPDGRQLLIDTMTEIQVVPLPPITAWSTASKASFNSAFSADGRWLAADTQGGDVVVLDRQHPTGLRHLRGHGGLVFGVRFAGDELLSASWDSTVRAWSPGDGGDGSAAIFRGHQGAVRHIAVDGAGHAFSVDSAGRIFALDLATGAATLRYDSPNYLYRIALSPDGGTIAAVAEDSGTLELIDRTSGQVRTFAAHRAGARAVAYGPGGILVSTGVDGVIDIRAGDGTPLHRVETGKRCFALAVAPTGAIAAACDRGHLVQVTPTPMGWLAQDRQLEHDLYGLAFSPDGRRLAIATNAGVAYVLDRQNGALAARQLGDQYVTSVAFSPDGERVVATTLTTLLYQLDVADLAPVPARSDELDRWLRRRLDTDSPVTTPLSPTPTAHR